MGTRLQRRPEGRLVGTSSSLAKLRTGARHAVRTIPAYYVAGVMTLQIILDIWSMSACLWETVVVVTAEILKPGDYRYIAQYTLLTRMDRRIRIRERHRFCLRTSSRLFI
jgi:hypothetical protein